MDLVRTRSKMENNIQCMAGYGKFYMHKLRGSPGVVSTVPIVNEVELVEEDHGVRYNCGPFMVMEGMCWNSTSVTVKRLHRNPPEGGCVDLLINEHDTVIQLRHPNILMLMGLCQTNSTESMVLVYEPVGLGSLFYYMHERDIKTETVCGWNWTDRYWVVMRLLPHGNKSSWLFSRQHLESVSANDVRRIAGEIGAALIFMHDRKMIHCSVTSHAVQLVSPHSAKLTDFQYSVPRCHGDQPARLSHVVHNKYMNAAYNWMAPELMDGASPSPLSDLYSYCVLLWEMFTGKIPWCGLSAEEIYTAIVKQGEDLAISEDKIPMPYCGIIQMDLHLDPADRHFSLKKILETLSTYAIVQVTQKNPVSEEGDAGRTRSESVTSLTRRPARTPGMSVRSPVSDQVERLQRTPIVDRLVSPVKRTPAERDVGDSRPYPADSSCHTSPESETSLSAPPKPPRSTQQIFSPQYFEARCSHPVIVGGESETSTVDGAFDFIQSPTRRRFFERTRKQWPQEVTVKISTTATLLDDCTTAAEESSEEVPVVVAPGGGKNILTQGSNNVPKQEDVSKFVHKPDEIQSPSSADVMTSQLSGQGHWSRDSSGQGHSPREAACRGIWSRGRSDDDGFVQEQLVRLSEAVQAVHRVERADVQMSSAVATSPGAECVDGRRGETSPVDKRRSDGSGSPGCVHPYSSIGGYKPATHQTELVTVTDPANVTCFMSVRNRTNRSSPKAIEVEVAKRKEARADTHRLSASDMSRNACQAAPLIPALSSWFAGHGSVRNLIRKFDEDKIEHPSDRNLALLVQDKTPFRARMPQQFCESTDQAINKELAPHVSPGMADCVDHCTSTTDIPSLDLEPAVIKKGTGSASAQTVAKKDWRRAGKRRKAASKANKKGSRANCVQYSEEECVYAVDDKPSADIRTDEYQTCQSDIGEGKNVSYGGNEPPSLEDADLSPDQDVLNVRGRMDVEEFYFDDVISPCMINNKHMRLQTTLDMDMGIGDSDTCRPDGRGHKSDS